MSEEFNVPKARTVTSGDQRQSTKTLVTLLGSADLRYDWSNIDADIGISENSGAILRIVGAHKPQQVIFLNDYGDEGEKAVAATAYIKAFKERFEDISTTVVPLPRDLQRRRLEELYVLIGDALSPLSLSARQTVFNCTSGFPKITTVLQLIGMALYPTCRLEEVNEKNQFVSSKPTDLRKLIADFSSLDERRAESISTLVVNPEHELQEHAAQKLDQRTVRIAKLLDRLPLLITGEPGAGKRTLIRRIIDQTQHHSFDTQFCNEGVSLPSELEVLLSAGKKPLVLIDIDRLPVSEQVRLLHSIDTMQSKKLRGKPATRPLVSTTTVSNLFDLVKMGKFREDLLYRLAVNVIHVRPLRERLSEIPEIARDILENVEDQPPKLNKDALVFLQSWPWPGNIRELHAVLARAVVATEGPNITVEILRKCMFSAPSDSLLDLPVGPNFKLDYVLDEVSSLYIRRALNASSGNQRKAAELIGLKETTLSDKIRKLGIKQKQT